MLIVGNWKAYVSSHAKAKTLFAAAKRLSTQAGIEIAVAVPAPYIGLLAPGNRSKISIAAQDLSLSTGGATTGETTAALLRDIGVSYAILGHSERRALGETDTIVLEKVQHALANKIIPIICIGESERDMDGNYLKFIRAQISSIYQALTPKERLQVLFAYEPIWAIGKTAAQAITSADLTEMMLYIRKILADYLPGKSSSKIRIIYGGSVEPGNIRLLAEGTGVDGFLPGHASADANSFIALVKSLK
jgi:triosephosphate isomerase